MFLALDTSAQALSVRKSTIPPPGSGLEAFANGAFGNVEMVGHYHGSLVHSDLTKERHKMQTYEEGLSQVTADIFKMWGNELAERMTDSDGNEHKVWIVPAPFCAMQYVNDARYLPGNATTESKSLEKPRENNVHFWQVMSPSTLKEFGEFTVLGVHAVHNISLDEELPVNYGRSTTFRVR